MLPDVSTTTMTAAGRNDVFGNQEGFCAVDRLVLGPVDRRVGDGIGDGGRCEIARKVARRVGCGIEREI